MPFLGSEFRVYAVRRQRTASRNGNRLMDARPFVPWSAEHVAVLVLTFGVPCSLGWWARRGATATRARVVAWSFAAILAALMIGFLLIGLGEQRRWQDLMPLHLCDLALFMCVAACIRRDQRTFAIAYFWGLGGTLQGLLTPELDAGFPSRTCLLFFTGHSGIVACVVFLAIAFWLRPTWRSVGIAYGWILAYAAVAGAFNAVFRTNYGFLRAKPTNPSLFDWLGPWPWYIATAAVLAGIVAGIVFVLLYLPWAIADRMRRSRQAVL
jgi:hypothetical integral membrane protein (TIGR02206 family)